MSVTPSLFPFTTPNLYSLFPPQPTRACDVAVWDNEVRTLLQQSVSLAPACKPHGLGGSVVLGALFWWFAVHASGAAPATLHFKVRRSMVDLLVTSRQRQYHCLEAVCCVLVWRTSSHSGGGGGVTSHFFTQSAYPVGGFCSTYGGKKIFWWKAGISQRVNRLLNVFCLSAEALFDKIQRHSTSLSLRCYLLY